MLIAGHGADVESRFRELRDAWRRDTRFYSDIERIVMHPAYQQVIGMGDTAVPFILSELDSGPGFWGWVLRAITGEDPVPPESQGVLAAAHACG